MRCVAAPSITSTLPRAKTSRRIASRGASWSCRATMRTPRGDKSGVAVKPAGGLRK